MTSSLTVSGLARQVGVSPDTIRYYERRGLLRPPERSASDYRVYDERAVDRMRFIRGAQRLGLKLDDVKTLLAVRDTGTCPCGPAEDLLRKRVVDIDAEMAELTRLRATLTEMVARIPSDCPEPVPGTWTPRTGGGDPAMNDDCCGDDSCTCC